MATNKDKADKHLLRGMRKRADGDLDGAIAEYTQALVLDPGLIDAYNNRGNAYAAKDDHARAIADYNEALDRDASNTIALFNRGLSYQLDGNPEAALADYEQALRIGPPNGLLPRLYLHLGIVHATLGDEAEAIEHFTEAIRRDRDNVTAFNNRGALYERQGKLMDAIADYREVLRLMPNTPGARRLAAFIQYVEALHQELEGRLSSITTEPNKAVEAAWPVVAKAIAGLRMDAPMRDPFVFLDVDTTDQLLDGARDVTLNTSPKKQNEDAA